MSTYELAPYGTPTPQLLADLLEKVSQGEAWLGAQRPTVEWEKVLETLAATDPGGDLKGMSNVGYKKTERIARELVASLSNFEHEGEVKPRFDQALYEQAHEITKLDHNWETETHSYNTHRAALQNAVVLGTGYLVEEFDPHFHGTHGDIRLTAYGPSDITFVQLPKDHDIQRAYMVIIRDEMPINLAKRTYPGIAHLLEPDRDAPNWLMKGLRKVQQWMGGGPALRVSGTNQNRNTASFPTVDIFRAYTLDASINEGPMPVQMGAKGTNWGYMVPALNDPISIGVNNPDGTAKTRPATAADCRLFPLRRYTIFSRTAVAYDGSSPWWHGQVPVARYRFNDWAWEALGKSLIGNLRTMEEGIVALMRCIEDASASKLDPALLYDENLASEGFANEFLPRKAGSRAKANLQAGKIIEVPLDASYFEIPQIIPEWIKAQEARMDYMAGTPDLVAIAKAKQVPSEGTLEKLSEMAGPLVQDMVRALEEPLSQLGQWRLAYFFQFYNRPRMIQLLGPDGELVDEQFLPNKIVPTIYGEPLQAKLERTQRYLNEFKYRLTKSGMNEIHRLQYKLAYLQLVKAGVPIDWWTIAKIWEVPNFGPEPEGTHTVMERWLAQIHLQREIQEEAQAGMPGGGQVGRPNSNKRPPQLVGKDGGTRHTVKTS